MRALESQSPAASGPTEGWRTLPLKDQAYEVIKHQIITCRFAPGEKLNEAQVAERLGLSRMPVHNALARLRLEGLVTIRPRKGIEVRPIDPEELLQIIDARTVNECRCAELAARQATEEELAAMANVLRRSETALARRDTEAMMLLDREFHDLIARASRSAVFFDILRNLHDRAVRFWFISLNEADHQVEVLEEHEDIYRTLAARDPPAAARAMARHIDAFRRNVLLLVGAAPG
ncbi:GntR family transcriptional regulator [Plastoroseomonas hellenica]|uniref:GntR family transcriptional regulator n=1 Tax=Plastoroseomonas hellenica TaxID=2687306 RepID=A0ABS5EXE0_9PROT|nr:GntR family transcriptional regulator [Plastoroseomonas hellenica]MBR0645774.1 GntR family transcriptional regulator [Plastoroseomonas hellenica]MBR0664575.1 GntR family transcriptional regulator [Plastoroseomonas hellenica]